MSRKLEMFKERDRAREQRARSISWKRAAVSDFIGGFEHNNLRAAGYSRYQALGINMVSKFLLGPIPDVVASNVLEREAARNRLGQN